MHKFKYLALLALGLFFCGVSHQDQTFNENISIGADDGLAAEGKRLYFGSPFENTDPFYISRFDRDVNKSDLRINISDDNYDDRLVFGTNWAGDNQFHPYVIINSNGRVGIGTESIGDERLAVNGKIRAKEVKIEAATWDTPWPDYVFGADYRLPELNSVGKFVASEHHLPGMPSAAEVDKNGIELGDMNKKLLKKVEELTLYLLQQNNIIKQQQKQIDNLDHKLTQIAKTD